jgi:hypothetical protein
VAGHIQHGRHPQPHSTHSIAPRYGPAGGGLLRLHSTYRHDLKIYSSDEGRVQMSAAAFTKVCARGLWVVCGVCACACNVCVWGGGV